MPSPSCADIERLARDALAAIPEPLARHLCDVVVQVVDFPDAETIGAMGLASKFDILGLYRGVSLDRKSITDTPTDLDMIFLYRRPLLDYWPETGDSLFNVVRNVMIHECGHHFGLSDVDMARIEEKI